MRRWVALFLWMPAGLIWAQSVPTPSYPACPSNPTMALGLPDAWHRVASVCPGDTIQVLQKDGKIVNGRFQSLSSESVVLNWRNQVRSLSPALIKAVSVRRKASRWKAAGIGAAVGFGIVFPIGAASAGYLTDRNSPRFATRAGLGAELGLFGAGIGAGLGALVGGSRYETVFRSK